MMKKIVPFKHEATFKTKISEVTSISLEHTLHKEENSIIGEFIVSGDYKISDTSTTTEYFNLNLPFEIDLDERYDMKDAVIDINDFYYEILNDDKLIINIEVVIDEINEKIVEVKKQIVSLEPEIEREVEIVNMEPEKQGEVIEKPEVLEEPVIKKESNTKKTDVVKEEVVTKNDRNEVSEVVENLMNVESETLEYTTYHIHIVRDGDTLDSILEKYSITSETLSLYNNLSELKIGDKLLIPANESN